MISWLNPGRPVILASRSPRRKAILSQMGFTFTVRNPSPIDEAAYIDSADLNGSLKRLACAKAQSIACRRPGSLVLGADTVVVKGTTVLGKPRDRSEAFSMLRKLSDGRHRVLTAVALICVNASFSTAAVARTDVFFRCLTVDEMEAYLDLGEYRDKAGAYAIQGRAMAFIDAVKGCYYNVVGLPVSETIRAFGRFVLSQREKR
jgi:septum formation protein